MANILCIDTSTEACSVAISSAFDPQVFTQYSVAPRKHAALILKQIEAVLMESKLELNQLDAIAVTVGPGAFTGVRLGIAVAQGLAFAAGLKIISVGTLETLAMAAVKQHQPQAVERCKIAVAIDARMGEVYWDCFEWQKNQLSTLDLNRVCPVNMIKFNQLKIDKDYLFAGTGWQAQADPFKNYLGFVPHIQPQLLLPNARIALQIANRLFESNPENAISAELIEPVYLRDKVAETTIERLSKKKSV